MAQVKVGLAPKKTSFWDPLTRTYLTLDNPVGVITFDGSTDLSRICRGLFTMNPALVLYEGQLPQEQVDTWKARFDLPTNGMNKRTDKVISQAAPTVTLMEAAEVTVESKEADPVDTAEPEENEGLLDQLLPETEEETSGKGRKNHRGNK